TRALRPCFVPLLPCAMGCHLLSSIFLFAEKKYSHGLLPSLFFFVIVLGVALGDFLLLFLTERFPVCVRMHGGAVHQRLSRLRLLQTVSKPHHSRSNAAVPISRTAHVGPSRCGSRSLGSLMLGREK